MANQTSGNHDLLVRLEETVRNLIERAHTRDDSIDSIREDVHKLQMEAGKMALKVGVIVATAVAIVNAVFGIWLVRTFGG